MLMVTYSLSFDTWILYPFLSASMKASTILQKNISLVHPSRQCSCSCSISLCYIFYLHFLHNPCNIMVICLMVQVNSNLKHIIDIVPFFTMKADNLFSVNFNHTTELQQATVVEWETKIQLTTISKNIIPSINIDAILFIRYNLKQRWKTLYIWSSPFLSAAFNLTNAMTAIIWHSCCPSPFLIYGSIPFEDEQSKAWNSSLQQFKIQFPPHRKHSFSIAKIK